MRKNANTSHRDVMHLQSQKYTHEEYCLLFFMTFAQKNCTTFHKTTSSIIVVTIAAVTVTIRVSVVAVGSGKGVMEKVVGPVEILISLTHAHPLGSNSLSKALPLPK